jgi:integrase
MSRRATGTIIEPSEKRTSWALRFSAYGKRRFITLGTEAEGWDRKRAEEELAFILAKVKRGEWQPEERPVLEEPEEEITFHEFASRWFEIKRPKVSDRTAEDYRWALELHLLPFFKDYILKGITPLTVEEFSSRKMKQGRLAPQTINKLLIRLSMILNDAVAWGELERNPAQNGRGKLKVKKKSLPIVEPEQLPALLEAAGELRTMRGYRPENLTSDEFASEYRPIAKPLIATLALAGPRIGEALALTWGDLSLGAGVLRIADSKTQAGIREIDLSRALAEILSGLRDQRIAEGKPVRMKDPIFGSFNPGRKDRSKPAKLERHNVLNRILRPAIVGANLKLAELGIEPIGHVTNHGLRKTFATIRSAAGDDLLQVMEQTGHEDPSTTIKWYARAVKRREKLSGATLEAFDRGIQLAAIGSNAAEPESSSGAEKVRISAL